jgi:hypothetical protein
MPERDLPIARIWTWSESTENEVGTLKYITNLINAKNSNERELGNSERNNHNLA